MASKDRKEFMIEDAHLIFMNFSGKEGPYNQEGQRQFSVVLDQDTASTMAADGWNVKVTKPKDDELEPIAFIDISVRFDVRPPRITMITNDGETRTLLDEDGVGVLDYMDIATVDLICSGYEWHVNDKTGVKAYLQTMFVTIDEDPLERKYAQMPK